MTEGPPASASLGREASVGEAVSITTSCGTYSVGGAGGMGAVGSLAFRFFCLMLPCCGDTSPLVLLLAPFSLGCAGIFLLMSNPKGPEDPLASGSVFSIPIASLFALSEIQFLFCWTRWGCFLESV